MKNNKRKVYVFWVVLCEAVGALSGLLSRGGIEIYHALVVKPALSPPAWVFPIVWIILFAFMGISAARVTLSEETKEKYLGLSLFAAQLIVNFFWPLLFFNAHAFGFALFWLILLCVLVLGVILIFKRVDKISSLLLLPYILWISFAVVLNTMVWRMNP